MQHSPVERGHGVIATVDCRRRPDRSHDDGQAGRGASGFVLEWRPVSISLSGPSASLRSLLERIAAADMMMHAKSVEMYPSNPSRQSLTLDMELWYFTLARKG